MERKVTQSRVGRIAIIALALALMSMMLVGLGAAFDPKVGYEVDVNSDGTVDVVGQQLENSSSGNLVPFNVTPNLPVESNQPIAINGDDTKVSIFVDVPSNADYNFSVLSSRYYSTSGLTGEVNREADALIASTDSTLTTSDLGSQFTTGEVSNTARTGFDKVINISSDGVLEAYYRTDLEPSDEITIDNVVPTIAYKAPPEGANTVGNIHMEIPSPSLDLDVEYSAQTYISNVVDDYGSAMTVDGDMSKVEFTGYTVAPPNPDNVKVSLKGNELYESMPAGLSANSNYYQNITITNFNTKQLSLPSGTQNLITYSGTFDNYDLGRMKNKSVPVVAPLPSNPSGVPIYSSYYFPNLMIETRLTFSGTTQFIDDAAYRHEFMDYDTSLPDPTDRSNGDFEPKDIVLDGTENPLVIDSFNAKGPKEYRLVAFNASSPSVDTFNLNNGLNSNPPILDIVHSDLGSLDSLVDSKSYVVGTSEPITGSETNVNLDIETSQVRSDASIVVVPHVKSTYPTDGSNWRPVYTYPEDDLHFNLPDNDIVPTVDRRYNMFSADSGSSDGNVTFSDVSLNSATGTVNITVDSVMHNSEEYKVGIHPSDGSGGISTSTQLGLSSSLDAGYRDNISVSIDTGEISDGDTVYAVLRESQQTGAGSVLNDPNNNPIADSGTITGIASSTDNGNNNTGDNTTDTTVSIEVDEDETDAEEVIVEKVNYSEGDYFVVVEDEEGEQVGSSEELSEGENSNVTVELDDPVADNETLSVAVYESDGGSIGSEVGGSQAEANVTVDVVAGGSGDTGNTLPILGDLPVIGDLSTPIALGVVGSVIALIGGGGWYYMKRREEEMST